MKTGSAASGARQTLGRRHPVGVPASPGPLRSSEDPTPSSPVRTAVRLRSAHPRQSRVDESCRLPRRLVASVEPHREAVVIVRGEVCCRLVPCG
jgi:hypothetical protein